MCIDNRMYYLCRNGVCVYVCLFVGLVLYALCMHVCVCVSVRASSGGSQCGIYLKLTNMSCSA